MISNTEHTFHIPVMGLAYTIDTPFKISRFGINSVVSIIQDHLIEQMREFYENKRKRAFIPILVNEIDHRATRITAYLNLMKETIDDQIEKMRKEPFVKGNDIVKYFELLPDDSGVKKLFLSMKKMSGSEKRLVEKQLKKNIIAGAIDVNIMTKLDRTNRSNDNEILPVEFSDAMSALRGYAKSNLDSSIIYSAGLNPRLFAYMSQFPDFFPNSDGYIKKRIILKVSDYRSALIQGKFLAKKGLWVSEFRIESGLNCGGHAFPTEGKLLGPILEEFKINREILNSELIQICNKALEDQKRFLLPQHTKIRLTVQGGIGTSNEDKFLREYYNLDGTGWGSPFLLVPEATNVDDKTLHDLTMAKKEDYYLSYASPLGIPFHNFRKSSSEKQRLKRIEKNRPGSPCYLKFLAFNTEYNKEKPICLASREYQNLKLKELEKSNMSKETLQLETEKILEKDCLCEGLTATALIKNDLPLPHKLDAVTICPGPNLAYFSKEFSLEQMVGHIYGRLNILNLLNRPHVFINELKIYFEYLKEEIRRNSDLMSDKKIKYFISFKANLLNGISYYQDLFPKIIHESQTSESKWKLEIEKIKRLINEYCLSDKGSIIFNRVEEKNYC